MVEESEEICSKVCVLDQFKAMLTVVVVVVVVSI